jgi:regulator of replication initiation timing
VKSIDEIESILKTYSGGPIVITSAKELLQHYRALEQKHLKLMADTKALNVLHAEVSGRNVTLHLENLELRERMKEMDGQK